MKYLKILFRGFFDPDYVETNELRKTFWTTVVIGLWVTIAILFIIKVVPYEIFFEGY